MKVITTTSHFGLHKQDSMSLLAATVRPPMAVGFTAGFAESAEYLIAVGRCFAGEARAAGSRWRPRRARAIAISIIASAQVVADEATVSFFHLLGNGETTRPLWSTVAITDRWA